MWEMSGNEVTPDAGPSGSNAASRLLLFQGNTTQNPLEFLLDWTTGKWNDGRFDRATISASG